MELFKLFGTILVDNDKANKSIHKTENEASGLSKTLSTAFSTVGKTLVAGVGVASAAIIGITKSATDAYAEYEQLLGGVETLFGESANLLMGYADQAYKTAGLSANQYMSTVTSFSASLLQSLGGDTKKASDVANQAVIDMSDNANKMGTSIELIQNAYQGFAKGNYTMLDNLKLGYGGTKTEMERLLAKANEINAQNGTATNYTIQNFSDIIEAIHVVQTEIGITGTTASEASTTIQGSLGMLKASWENVLIGVASGNENLGATVGILTENVNVFLNNLIPVVQEILAQVPMLITTLAPAVMELIKTLLPTILEGAMSLLIGLASALPELIQVIIDTIPVLIQMIGQAVAEAFPEFFNTISTFFQNIVDGFKSMYDWTGKNKTLLQLIAVAVGTLTTAILAYNAAAIVKKALDIAETVQIAALIAADYAHAVASGVATAATTAFGAAVAFLTSPITLVILAIGALIAIGVLLYKNWDVVKAKCLELGTKLKEIWNGIKTTITNVWNNIKSTISGAINNVKSTISNGLNTAKSTVFGVLESIRSKFTSIWDSATSIVSNAINKIKSFFNFNWSLPKIKLPHFSISGKFSLNPPSIPHFSVDWYKKAMDNAMILNSPTIFGYSQASGKMLGGGEAGAEVVSGADTLMKMIQGAVASQNDVLADILYKILEAILGIDENIGDNLAEAMAGVGFKVNDREFARLVKRAVT